ncbi:50S ribosomal protein L10 [Companilactobacillus paralimentarius DSM 13238 = JCM 10415]|jgi:Ribosomal protein L10|uniref:Large ribosomal subunit protein uL10 n=1 Tax=Companilactobacillus paralimentarius DSM 13238 = JCM 10415 TaxID=1122151 RepID=A0A0R1PJK7_9LACO|nr:50S ribosomal protein L10 [Companilactobacillus paralimentarius]KAE9564980.1 50S ribosomal protein L10 [Companilactobacillus paralimentarius]KRL30197.1 50S ribosomal protein L10 [Companilactobacillus paralimentarius DSM 13238 = JCM 10415]MDR4933359.1 50S ribosomal protein L10 [Companilactobacillus paralimentarius]QFR69852.1 50S ribosomal protein L10 [Companilactobacillus paralimentarius]
MKQEVLAQKQAQVDEIAKQLTGAKSVIVVDYLGLTVEQATEMRAELREQNATMQVVKNTILRRAAEKAGVEGLEKFFVGPTAIAYSEEDPVGPAKIAAKFAKDVDAVEIKGGIIEGKAATLDQIQELATLPDRDGMLSMLVSVLQAPVRDFAMVVKAVADKEDAGQEA